MIECRLKSSEVCVCLATEVRTHLNNKYKNHIKIFIVGSILDSLDGEAGFVIPDLKVHKPFYLGEGISPYSHLNYM